LLLPLVFTREYDEVLEKRLPPGKKARDQARRHALLQPSPGKDLLEQARQLKGQNNRLDERITLYTELLQMEQATLEDRFLAYFDLIPLHKFVGNRQEAKRLLEAFAKEAEPMPAVHWVHDDLERVRSSTFKARYALEQTRRALTTPEATSGNPEVLYRALSHLVFSLSDNYDIWTTLQDRFDIYTIFIETYLRLGLIKEAKDMLSRLAVEAVGVSPEDTIHDVMHRLTVEVSRHLGDEEQ
jgi:hypothetical protein